MRESRFLLGFQKLLVAYEAMCRNEMLAIGLTISQALVLVFLNTGDKPSQQAIADQCGLDKATLSRVVDWLEKQGLVKRMPAANSRRAFSIHILEAGRRKAQEAQLHFLAVEDRFLQGYTPHDEAELLRLIGLSYANIRGDVE